MCVCAHRRKIVAACCSHALLLPLFSPGCLAQKVKVEPEVVSYPGQTVNLRCQFPDPGQTQLTQVRGHLLSLSMLCLSHTQGNTHTHTHSATWMYLLPEPNISSEGNCRCKILLSLLMHLHPMTRVTLVCVHINRLLVVLCRCLGFWK